MKSPWLKLQSKNSIPTIGIGIICLVVLGVAFYIYTLLDTSNTELVIGETQQQKEAILEETSYQKESDGENAAVLAQEAGVYTTYSQEKYEAAQATTRVLFFHAAWCPTCIAADEAFSKRQDELPFGVTVFKTDYDTESELKKEYGVTYQHTFVAVDSKGVAFAKWNGGDIDTILEEIQ